MADYPKSLKQMAINKPINRPASLNIPQLLEELRIGTLKAGLGIFMEKALTDFPLHTFNPTDVATYPHLPDRDWTEEELISFQGWLRHVSELIRRHMRSTWLAGMDDETCEPNEEYHQWGLLESYFACLAVDVLGRKSELSLARIRIKRYIQSLAPELRLSIKLALQNTQTTPWN